MSRFSRIILGAGGAAALAALPLASASNAAQKAEADLVNRQQLRVCADPADMPFSNSKEEGFENKIAEVIGDELGLPVVYTWYPKATGFTRRTLFAKRCDLVIGWGQGDELVLNTNHFYRSVYAIVTKADGELADVKKLNDPKLKDKNIGIIAGTPPADHMARYGLMGYARPYQLVVDRRYSAPGQKMAEDIASGEIAAGVLWGPLAAYWSKQVDPNLKVIPLLEEEGSPKLHYRITFGVRQSDNAWKRKMNEVIAARQGDIDKVLLDYGVPLLVDDDTSMETITKPRENGAKVPVENLAAEAPKKPRRSVPVPSSAGGL